ncbi:hypothetical protein [Puia dinghuensis]|uniref:DUF3575 domain-containing protein n=1 Tax=Puia dinghuensis TaxID=1792502 RepID=A0A8J2U774_9BACT|nr:hypothetical protein [Puia dinghuensis]GGA83269.1 hypothetical protein GCM10011511_02890 [Puia dinghuensis]
MRKTLFVLGIVSFLFTNRSFAQAEGSSYETAVGLKFWPGALTVKHFIQDDRALEGILSFWDGGFRLTGLYEFHGDINGAPGLKWYVGPGAHLGWYNGDYYHGYYYNSGALSIGVDGILGLEYKFDGAPIAISADINPYIEFNHPYFDVFGGLGVKYTW